MSSSVNAIVINGYVGKELTLEYLNKMLIERGVNVMYLKLNENDELMDILVNNERIDHSTYKMDEIIFDESDIFIDIYAKMNCDVVIVKSSKYNLYLNIILYVISKCNSYTLEKLTNNSFLTRRSPIITSVQSKDIMIGIYRICENLKIIPFISEHFHYSYIKYNTGIVMDYSYLSFALALNTLEIFKIIPENKELKTYSPSRVKLYNLPFYKIILPSPLQVKIQLDNNYYMKTIEKYNIRFYCNAVKTASSAVEIIDWFTKSSNPKNVKICIFHILPTLELIDIVNNLCSVKYSSVYIIDYKDIGFSYNNLIYANKYNLIPELNCEWTETIYKAFIKKVYKNITIDNPVSIIDWIFKYTGLHEDTKFDVLCVGSKKLIDDIVLKIN